MQSEAQLAGRGGEVSLALFGKLKKSTLILEKKCPDCANLWIKFLNSNAVLRVFRRKKLRNFSAFTHVL